MKILLIPVAIAAFALSSCNTTAGIGQDIQKAGEGITRGAEKAKPSNN
ncbi:MAG: entericidin A/B family lipoprotein [Verrucomicrobiota bacterium]